MILVLCVYGYLGFTEPEASEKLPVRVVPLAVTHREVRDYALLLRQPIKQAATVKTFAAFLTPRQVWVMPLDKKPAALSDIVTLPNGYNYYLRLCPAGDKMAIPVANYSEEQRKKDRASPQSGYREGPTPVGVLVVSLWPRSAEYIPYFRVTEAPDPDPERALPEAQRRSLIPKRLAPSVQGCRWNGRELVVSGYGFLAHLNLTGRTARLEEYDYDFGFNRVGLYLDGQAVWYVEDEGGLYGGCIAKTAPGSYKTYCLLNQPAQRFFPDAIIRHKGHLLTSSEAGIVEIEEQPPGYVQYRLTKDSRRLRVSQLTDFDGSLWGVREDGWVRLDLSQRAATLYRFAGREVSNDIRALIRFGGAWYVANESALYRVFLESGASSTR